ncbi:hypothetical protein DPMN_191527 [Dreissena polymorpha]|uniref:Uncharacterized protein n=1 Tax=Dreissena polymorpha TaxID=45954 RepID=A0A9D3XY77_DREPO|nr:hypothetical protein DPMN_191527 [Dreissena polymorpha]
MDGLLDKLDKTEQGKNREAIRHLTKAIDRMLDKLDKSEQGNNSREAIRHLTKAIDRLLDKLDKSELVPVTKVITTPFY